MKKYARIYTLFLMFVFCTSCEGQNKADRPQDNARFEAEDVSTAHRPDSISHTKDTDSIKSKSHVLTSSRGPNSITRNIIQDRKGDIWIASWEGIFRYGARMPPAQGKSFTNITSKVSSARFFSLLEDRKGNLWFGSIGSGVYYYDGKSLPAGQVGFRNFTTKDGLLNNDVGSIYEDKKGNIWFGVFGGVSRYDGKLFRNYIINGDEMSEDRTGKTFQNRPPYEVNSIIEDKNGKFWFATRGNTFVYDARLPDGQGKTFTVLTHEGKPFKNVRSIIEDKKGNIWLGGQDGLWRYDGSTFTHFTRDFVGYVYEDKKGNIWTSSESSDDLSRILSGYNSTSLQRTNDRRWALSRYDATTLSAENPTATQIKTNEGMIFGILEADDGSIWFGTLDGVYRYDGNIITSRGTLDAYAQRYRRCGYTVATAGRCFLFQLKGSKCPPTA